MRALITDAHDRKALAGVRSLGARGWQVWVGGSSRWDQAFYSRYCRRRILYPEPSSQWDRFAEALLSALKHSRCSVWLPMSDYTTMLAARCREELAGSVGLAVPTDASFELAKDKPRLLELATEVGLRVPATCPCDSLDEAVAAARQVGYPCIIKPREGAGAVGVHLVRDAGEMERLWPLAARAADPAYDYSKRIVEEYVPGEMHAANVLLDHGTPVAAFTQHRLSAVSPLGGLSSMVVSTHEPALIDQALALLGALRWHGPAQTQFIVDTRDGRPTLLEVNGRFWGSVDLAIQAGVDFPYLAACVALGRRVKPCFRYEVGLAYRWWFPHGLMHVLHSRRPVGAALHLVTGPKEAARILSDLRKTDLVPAVVEAMRSGLAAMRGHIL